MYRDQSLKPAARSETAVNKALGSFVAQARTGKWVSQKGVANALGISQSVLCRKERGAMGFTVCELLNACELLDVDPAQALQVCK